MLKRGSKFARPGVMCNADHIAEHQGERYYFRCVLQELHAGEHRDCRGRTWTLMWPSLAHAWRGGRKPVTRY